MPRADRWKCERLRVRDRLVQRHWRKFHFAFERFQPDVLVSFTCQGLQKSYCNFERRIVRLVARETFGLNCARFAAVLRFAVLFRINATKGEPLTLVLLRRSAIRIKNVALVKNSINDLIDEFAVHWHSALDKDSSATRRQSHPTSSLCVATIGITEQPLHRLFPRGKTLLAFEFVEPLEDAALEREECAVRIMPVHHFLPGGNWHSPCAFLFPGNSLDLQALVRTGIEQRAAEQKQQRHFAMFEPVKVFRACNVQIERAWHSDYGFSSISETRHNAIRVRPQFIAQGLSPIFRSAEQLTQFVFLAAGVSTL